MKSIALFLVFGIVIGIHPHAFGYGLGDAESQIVEIDDKKLKLKTIISPEIIDQNNPRFNVQIELLDSISEELFSDISYDLKILDSNDMILFENKIHATNDKLSINFTPQKQQDFEIVGEKIDNQFWLSSNNDPLEITGPIFLEGGIYKIQASVKTLENQEIQTPNSFETILIIGEIIPFQITDDGIDYNLRFITYFDTIKNLSFDEEVNAVKAEMKFNWQDNSINEIPFIHSEVYLPKSWNVFTNHEINTFVNGIQVFGLVDKSQEDEIIIHFLINSKQLRNLAFEIDEFDKEKIIFEVRKGELITLSKTDTKQEAIDDAMVELSTKSDWKIYLWWEPLGKLFPGNDVTFNIMFHDPDTNLMQKNVTYDLSIYQNDEIIKSISDSSTSTGHVFQEFTFDNEGDVRFLIENINDEDTAVEFEFYVGDESQKISIPDWIKNNSRWWAEGNIDDSTFASGIEFMIKEKIIQVPETEKQQNETSDIPDWVKNNASWWANDQISDKDFASGLQYLIKSGIITV